jgi:hypothetical protein
VPSAKRLAAASFHARFYPPYAQDDDAGTKPRRSVPFIRNLGATFTLTWR